MTGTAPRPPDGGGSAEPVGAGPLTHGQLSLWRDIEGLARGRWHEANLVRRWRPGGHVTASGLRDAAARLQLSHAGLRTTFSFTDPPSQHVARPAEIDVEIEVLMPEEVDAFAARPFDLTRGVGWRVGLIAPGDDASIVLVVHHLVADGHALDLMRDDLGRLLRHGEIPPGVAPLTLVAAEASPIGRRRADAALRHWAESLDRPGRRDGLPPSADVPLCHVEMATGVRREELAAGLPPRASPMAAVLSALARRASTDDAGLFVRIMVSNRISAERRRCVTTMNEWVPATLTGSGQDPRAAALSAAAAAAASLRHGIYDVDGLREVLRIRGLSTADMDDALSFNHIDVPAGTSPSARPPGEVRVDHVGITVGPRAYLRALAGHELVLSFRVADEPAWRSWAEAQLLGMRERLLALSRP
jgi:hypothetical protein